MKILKFLSRSFMLMLVFSINYYCLAQEAKVPLMNNAVIKNYVKNHPENNHHQKSIQTVLTLPFFDDFSSSSIYPDSSKWIGKSVFVNTDFPINPPSIGVATFDGLDQYGRYYANQPSVYPADTLTSQPINLSSFNTSNDTTLYLSFFYQAGGRGNTPDQGDSLVLQFKANDSTWITVWGADGGSGVTDFKQVFVHVYDTIYYDNGFLIDTIVGTFLSDSFQFRFMNYVSGFGMVDIWNLDYVYLNNNRHRTDTTLLDMAFVYKGPSLLKNYSQMPWTHYRVDTVNNMATQYPITIRNNDVNSHVLTFRSFVYQYSNPTPIYQLPSGGYVYTNNALSDSMIVHNISDGSPSPFSFPTHVGDFAEFPVMHCIDHTGGDNDTLNDTIRNVQRFSDYYAYDDGTAEWAWGLANTPGGEMAMQFTTTKDDSLQGAYIFFAQMVEEVSLHLFSLAVWNDNAGQPGTLIYQKIDQRPIYDTTGVNAFHYYRFDSSILSTPAPLSLHAGTYYIGWIQVDGTSLNIGLDENSNWDSTKLFFNTTNYWQPSSIYGTVMIRPVFGSSMDLGVKDKDNQLAATLDIYPNPASNKINLRWTSKEHIQAENLLTEIFDTQGRLLLSHIGYQQEIDITSISEGFYFAKITDTKSAASFTKKLIINR